MQLPWKLKQQKSCDGLNYVQLHGRYTFIVKVMKYHIYANLKQL